MNPLDALLASAAPAQDSVVDRASAFFEWTSGILWGPWMLAALVGTHLYLTIRLGVIQRWLWPALRLTFRTERSAQGDVSPFGALATALAATVGAGNIIGVAVAVAAGGPGAIFWMWLTGVFGIATKYAEALLAVQFRVRNERGEMSGGPMYVLAHGLRQPWLGTLFAVFTVIAAFGIGNMFQAKAVTASVLELVPDGTPETPVRVASGLIMAAVTGVVLIGGIKSIARFCEILVPFMIASYLIGCGIILAMHWAEIPGAITLILSDACSGSALAGGGLGAMIAAGVKRGLFSNESGLGSAPIAAAAARSRNPAQQALVSMTGTFWDTVVICLLTGLVLVVTGAWNSGLEGAAMSHHAFGKIPYVGPTVLTVGLISFVFSTLIGWSYYGEKALEYLGGLRFVPLYRWLWLVAIFLGATVPSSLVINFSDSANALMAIPNLISLLLLSGLVARESRTWLAQPETFE
ncbi:MAG: alanine/glycine:cation symporter family protein [Planctomycetaceae bacterium]